MNKYPPLRTLTYINHRQDVQFVFEPFLSDHDRVLLRLIDAEYTRRPFYGNRRMVVSLHAQGYVVNRKHDVQRLMRVLGLAGPKTSQAHPRHKIYPYRLRGLVIVCPNQVWSTGITYVRLNAIKLGTTSTVRG